jgi:hypothetical protein
VQFAHPALRRKNYLAERPSPRTLRISSAFSAVKFFHTANFLKNPSYEASPDGDRFSTEGHGLVNLGERTGLSAALLSNLERGKLFPTLFTLLRIAIALGVGLEYFFTDERKRRTAGIVRREERLRFPERSAI